MDSENSIPVTAQAMIAMEAAWRRHGQLEVAKMIRDRFPDLDYQNTDLLPR